MWEECVGQCGGQRGEQCEGQQGGHLTAQLAPGEGSAAQTAGVKDKEARGTAGSMKRLVDKIGHC